MDEKVTLFAVGNRLLLLVEPVRQEPAREEWLRRERVAVGQICECGDCFCCEELKRERREPTCCI